MTDANVVKLGKSSVLEFLYWRPKRRVPVHLHLSSLDVGINEALDPIRKGRLDHDRVVWNKGTSMGLTDGSFRDSNI